MRFPCFTKQSYLPFAKSSAVVREGQRSRSRTATQMGSAIQGKRTMNFYLRDVDFCTLPHPAVLYDFTPSLHLIKLCFKMVCLLGND